MVEGLQLPASCKVPGWKIAQFQQRRGHSWIEPVASNDALRGHHLLRRQVQPAVLDGSKGLANCAPQQRARPADAPLNTAPCHRQRQVSTAALILQQAGQAAFTIRPSGLHARCGAQVTKIPEAV